MSDEALDRIARRSQLLMEKDEWSKARRKGYEEARKAGEHVDDLEFRLRELEKEELAALRDAVKS